MKPIDSEGFKDALAQFASGVTVITVNGDAGPHGMTASAFCSVSLSPPLVLVCVKKGNSMWGKLKQSRGFAVNVLSGDQEALSNRFAGGLVDEAGNWKPWPEERSKFQDLDYRSAPESHAPILAGTLAGLDCIHEQEIEAGDHTVFIGRVMTAQAVSRQEGKPLVYFAGGYRELVSEEGHRVD